MSVGGIIFFRVIRRQLIARGQASGGSSVGRGSLRGITAGHKRREQAVPPALVRWLEQEDQRLKKHVGRWMDIQQPLLLESCVH